jgi:uncharacterized RDD family membrane protein YckC
MDTMAMASTLRDQGLQALREGKLEDAAELLARAVMADGRDAEARACLGVVYSQRGLHAQAIRALQAAVELAPHESRFHYNLGVARASAGDRPGAAAAFGETLRLRPDHAQAQARLKALGETADVSQAQPAGSQPAPSPWAAGGNGSSTAPPPGSAQCSQCRQWSKPGLSCEWCSATLRPPAPPSAPWLQPGHGTAAGTDGPDPTSPRVPEMTARDAMNKRWLAGFIDGLVCFGIRVVAGLAVGVPTGVSAAMDEGTLDHTNLAATQGMALLLGLVLCYVYYVGMVAARGQTLGKMAVGLRVVNRDGEKPTFAQALVRETFGKLVSGLPLFLGYLWMLWDGEQQTWHDKMAATYVERT